MSQLGCFVAPQVSNHLLLLLLLLLLAAVL